MLSYDEYKAIIEDNLVSFIPEVHPYAATLRESMAYSLEVGGKRLRPVLLLASCDYAGGSIEEALPYACALEFIHTYSLIHDDLPAMDNDDLRRGHPTNHKVYGEGMAVLAGDGLLNTACEIMSQQLQSYFSDHERLVAHAKAGYDIMRSAGINGMIGGQCADVENETKEATKELVDYIEANKTGALIAAPVLAGLHIAGADDETISHFDEYARKLGQAFQVSDDILDVEGDEALIGKRIGKDLEAGKCNYAYVLGLDEAKEMLHSLTEGAKAAVRMCGEDTEFFTQLADRLEIRKA